MDNRRFFNPDVQNQFIFHSRLHYKKDKWDFATGLTLSWAFTQKPDAGYDQAVNEIRPVNEVSYELPLGKIFLQNRIRLDHRFFQEDATTSVWDESFYVLRIRYRAQIRIPLKQDGDVTRVSLRIADEIMLNHTKNTFDQNRIYLTSDFYLSEKITLEAGYIYIYQHQLGRHEFYDRHVLRVSILHKLRL